jgi:hypothetical protein
LHEQVLVYLTEMVKETFTLFPNLPIPMQQVRLIFKHHLFLDKIIINVSKLGLTNRAHLHV